MSQLLVSSKYQVVIPKDVRRQLNIHAGQKVICIAKDGVIHLILDKPLSALRGIAKGLSLGGLREKKDRM